MTINSFQQHGRRVKLFAPRITFAFHGKRITADSSFMDVDTRAVGAYVSIDDGQGREQPEPRTLFTRRHNTKHALRAD